jgi:hypothetical protein
MEEINAFTILVWKYHGRRPIGRTRRRQENNIEKLFKK